MIAPSALADAARSLIGTPFVLHGRDPDHGLDCVGLVMAAMQIAGARAPEIQGYGLANSSVARWLPLAEAAGWKKSDPANARAIQAGDLLLVQPGPARFHLILAVDDGAFVHADAGLRRAVCTPGPLPWPVIASWRLFEQ